MSPKSSSSDTINRREAIGVLTAGAAASRTIDAPVAHETARRPRDARSFADFGALPDGQIPVQALRDAIAKAWASALANGHDLYHPGGVYDIGDMSFPWRNTFGATALLDCRNITIHGSGPNSIFQTSSSDGADVFQLRALRNLHFRNIGIKAVLDGGASSGSNGISITGGYDNITLLDVWCEGLPAVSKSDHLDGGKALTIQCDQGVSEVGYLKARIFAKACAYGLGFDSDLAAFAGMKVAVDVDLVAEDCYAAVVVAALEAKSPVPDDAHSGLSITAQSINCQKDIVLGRVHGIEVTCNVVSSKPAARRRRNDAGRQWLIGDTRVEALVCAYAKNARIRLHGNKGECDHKLRIGSAGPGSSGMNGSTSDCEITVDLGGTASGDAIAVMDDHGPPLVNSALFVTTRTGTVPGAFQAFDTGNLIVHGTQAHMADPTISGMLTLTERSADRRAGRLRIVDGAIDLQRSAPGAASQLIAGFRGPNGQLAHGIRGDGATISTGAINGAQPDGDIVAVRPEYDANNALIGYVAIYAGHRKRPRGS